MTECICTRDQKFSHSKTTRFREPSKLHYHEEHELYYLIKGSATFWINSKTYTLFPGDFIFIPRGIPHKTDNTHAASRERFLLSIEDSLFDGKTGRLLQQLSSVPLMHVPQTYLPIFEELFFKLETEYQNAQKGNDLLSDLYTLELLTLLCRYQQPYENVHSKSDALIHTVSEYLHSHYDQDISLHSLCRIFSLSEGHLSRRFKKVTGMGVNQYINILRIRHAEALLLQSSLSLTDISKQCGFNSSNYFSTVFKKQNGLTPKVYRKRKKPEL